MVNIDNIAVVKSSDSGTSWNIVNSGTGFFASLACSSNGNIVYHLALENDDYYMNYGMVY